jgi:predicted SnoaL-like aldol condensation-catalyzing enzyme
MTPQTGTAEQERDGFTAETFAQFWASPDLSAPAAAYPLHDDVIGYWPGTDEPVRGRDEYVGALKELLARVPDLTLQVVESADNGEHLFIRWVAHASGTNGRIEQTGVDRVKVVDGKVVENRIFFDRAQFERKLGVSLDL